MIELPGLIDVHVHLREPGETHKEDFSTGTAAALAGGVTTVLAMPNTNPPLLDLQTLSGALELAGQKAYCDFGLFLGGGEDNAQQAAGIADRAAGLKLYLDATYGPLLLKDLNSWKDHIQHWPRSRALAAHAEGRTLAALLAFCHLYQRPAHICHVSRKVEIELIKDAKAQGLPVTCEVAPHHLFLSEGDLGHLPPGRKKVSPPLNTAADRQALWDNLDVIDCIASDHAPHTVPEKDGPQPPPGFPGLETTLPLLITAVQEGRLSLEDVIEKMVLNPRKIFSLPEQPETWVEVDETHSYEIVGSNLQTRAKWTPFEGSVVSGLVTRVVLRGRTAYQDGKVLVEPGYGVDVQAGS